MLKPTLSERLYLVMLLERLEAEQEAALAAHVRGEDCVTIASRRMLINGLRWLLKEDP